MSIIKKVIKDNEIKGLLEIYLSQALVIIFAFTYNLLLSKNLNVVIYGEYRYLINFYIFSNSIFLFGLQYSISKLLTTIKNKKRINTLISLILLIIFFVSTLFYFIVLFMEKFGFNGIFTVKELRYNLIYLIIPLTVILLQFILQGLGKIKELAKLNIAIPIFQFIIFIFIKFLKVTITSKVVTAIYLSSNFIIILIILWDLKFVFSLKNFKSNCIILYLESKKIGIPIYTGALCSVGIQNLLNIVCRNYSTNLDYGYYGLSLTLSSPLIIIASSFGTVLYKKMSTQSFIEKKYIKLSIGMIFITYILYSIFIWCIFKFFYNSEYINAMYMTLILGLSSVILGLGDFFNRFIMVKGYGKELRNNTIILGVITLIISLFFLENFQILGMIFSKLISSFIYVILMIRLYLKIIQKQVVII